MKKIKEWLRSLFFANDLPSRYPEYNFEKIVICGRTFYRFTDDTMMPTMRALAYMNALEMIDNRINPKDIDFFCDRIDYEQKKFLQKQKDGKTLLGLAEMQENINTLTVTLREKNKLAFTSDMIYNLASVLFMDDSEVPMEYNSEEQGEKIKFFKEQGQYFFYKSSVRMLLPPSLTSQDGYQTYIQQLLEKEKRLTNFLIHGES